MKWSQRKFKLIACDVDGTLVPEGHNQLDSRFVEICKKAEEKDIILCIASGRQYDNLLALTHDFKDDLVYISVNGCAIYQDHKLLAMFDFLKPDPEKLCREIEKFPATEYIIGSLKGLHANPRKQKYRQHLLEEDPSNVYFIDGYDDIKNIKDITKITLFHPDDADQFYSHFASKWGEVCNIATSGVRWLDFTNGTKGQALEHVADLYNISLEDTLVLGDNFNDIPMFEIAGYKTAMTTSHPLVKKKVDQVISDPYRFLLDYLDS